MSQQQPVHRICPYLGLVNDPASHYRGPDAMHYCFSPKQPGAVALDQQGQVCFSSDYGACQRFAVPAGLIATLAPVPAKLVTYRRLQTVLLGLLLLIPLAGLVFLLFFFSSQAPTRATKITPTIEPTSVARETQSPIPAQTSVATRAVISLPTPIPLFIPTPPAGGLALTLPADSARTGWIVSNEQTPRWDERGLFAGMLQDQTYQSVIQFDLSSLPPKSKILFAVVELIGRDSTRLDTMGEWKLELLDGAIAGNLEQASFQRIADAPAVTQVGETLAAEQLGTGQYNRFEFDQSQRQLVEKQLDYGTLTFRMSGPSDGDNVFMWAAGSGTPTLYLVAQPAAFDVVTLTPTPANVLTAAAVAVRSTEFARRFGTPTPIRRMATPTLDVASSLITPLPTPANTATAQFLSEYATAVAVTTGTFTPTPPNLITTTPMPLLIPVEKLTPVPTPTPTAYRPSSIDLARKPIPAGLYNKIAFLESPRSDPKVWVMDPDGSNVALLTSREVYDIVQAREPMSPDGTLLAMQDGQLWLMDLNYPNLPSRQITNHNKAKLIYGPAWSPDGRKIAYVSDELGAQDIWVYTLNPQSWDRITIANQKDNFWNQFPSWSPDGKQIVFTSDRGHTAAFSEIWAMDANGSNLRKLGNGIWDTFAPIWIKWQR